MSDIKKQNLNPKRNKFISLIILIHLGFLVAYYAFKGAIMRKRRGDIAFFATMRKWGKKMVAALGIDLIVEGKEKISSKERYVYIANHTSLLDIPILLYAIPDYICFMYKKELEKVPILGFGLKYSSFIPIERENPKDAMQSVNKAVNLINKIGSVILFPEGTRSEDGKVASFKRGAFVIASQTNKRVVPVSIIGLNKILPARQFNLHKGTVKIVINSPIAEIPKDRVQMKNAVAEIHDIIAKQVENEKNNL